MTCLVFIGGYLTKTLHFSTAVTRDDVQSVRRQRVMIQSEVAGMQGPPAKCYNISQRLQGAAAGMLRSLGSEYAAVHGFTCVV